MTNYHTTLDRPSQRLLDHRADSLAPLRETFPDHDTPLPIRVRGEKDPASPVPAQVPNQPSHGGSDEQCDAAGLGNTHDAETHDGISARRAGGSTFAVQRLAATQPPHRPDERGRDEIRRGDRSWFNRENLRPARCTGDPRAPDYSPACSPRRPSSPRPDRASRAAGPCRAARRPGRARRRSFRSG